MNKIKSFVKSCKTKFTPEEQRRFVSEEKRTLYKQEFKKNYSLSKDDIKSAKIKNNIPNIKESMKHLLGVEVNIIQYGEHQCDVTLNINQSGNNNIYKINTNLLSFNSSLNGEKLALGEVVIIKQDIEAADPSTKALHMPGREKVKGLVIKIDKDRKKFPYLLETKHGAVWTEEKDFNRVFESFPHFII